jgi:diguanylate cyclase (GGDEF)-like protein/PAS domain S-box-containing protein
MPEGGHDAGGAARTSPDRRRARARITGALLIGGLAIAAALVGWNDLRVRREAGARYVAALAGSDARQLALMLGNLERAFRGVGADVAAIERDAPQTADRLRAQAVDGVRERHPDLLDLRITTTAPAALARAASTTRLTIGPPQRIAGRGWALPLLLALPADAEGRPRHLTGLLNVHALREVVADHALGRDGIASVLHRDGRLVVRADNGARHTARDLRATPLYAEQLPGGEQGVFDSRSPIDGVDRMIAYRALAGYPLVVSVGIARDELLAGWRAFVIALAIGCALLLLAWMTGLWMLGRGARREQDMQRSIAQSAELHARSEARFQLVASATSDAIWDWDVVTGELWWSEGFRTHYGWDWREAAATQQGREALIHPDDCARIVASLDAAIDGGAGDWQGHYRLRCADGRYADVEDRGRILRDADGRAVRAVGGMLDVTRQRRDEADLRLLRRAVGSSGNGIVIIDAFDAEHRLVYVNPAFERMTGYRADQVLGRSYRILLSEEHDPGAWEKFRHAIASGQDMRAEELRSVRKDGTTFWNEVAMTPVHDRNGRLTHYVAILNDITERKRVEEALAHRATHDALTGLANRDLLIERLREAIAAASAAARRVGVAFIDLDDFKLINDSLGHAVGDDVLRILSYRLTRVVGDDGLAARFGGDEFVLMLNCSDGDELDTRLREVLDILAQPVEAHGGALQVTPSLGYCRYPEDGVEALELLRHADQAMYEAKRRGRNRVVAYRPELDHDASQRLELILQLREALRLEQFTLVFQPQFDIQGRPVGLEALLRWRHPQRGVLAPGLFITACEDSGLIVPIGRWVLREAARHHRLLAERGWDALRIAVNVSAAQFQHGLAEDVAAVMQEFALPPKVLELELTESVVMADPNAAIRSMAGLSELGVSIAIDDFGTGYSSLAYLKRLPLDRLKLDRSFVQDLGRDPDDEAICGAIIRLAQSLDLGTTAEGVETEIQWRWLMERGCEEVQGYLFAKPAPFEEIVARLGKDRAVQKRGVLA